MRPALARSYRTIAFDHRDSGESTIASSPYGIHDLVADALAVLDAAGARRAHVLGHSMGGAVVQELALRHASRCASLTLACTWCRNDVYTTGAIELMSALTSSVGDDRTLLAAILYAGGSAETLQSAGLFAKTDAAMALGPLPPRRALLRQWAIDREIDTLDRLHQLDLPVHVLWCPQDRMLPPPASQLLLTAIPHAAQTRIDGCGHLPMVDRPEAFAAAVTGFLARKR